MNNLFKRSSIISTLFAIGLSITAAHFPSSAFGAITLITYPVTVASTGTGTGTVSGAGNYAVGATVNLTATPAANSHFMGWSPSTCANIFAMPNLSRTLAQSLTCTATFTQTATVALLQTTGTGSGRVSGGGNYAAGETVRLSAFPSADSVFAGWSPSPCAESFIMPVTTAVSRTTLGSVECTAAFNKAPSIATYKVTTNTVTSGGGNGGIVTGAGNYASGAAVALTATPNANFGFWYWGCSSGGTVFYGSSNNNPTNNFTMPLQDVACTANFAPLAAYFVTLNKAGTGNGTISGAPAVSIVPGTAVNLVATPDANSTFDGWSPAPCASSFAMPSNDVTCTASFSPKTISYKVTINKIGTGTGAITGDGVYPTGAAVSIKAQPNAGSILSNSFKCSPSVNASYSNYAFNFAMPTNDITCSVEFIAVYDLSMGKIGNGSGTAGIKSLTSNGVETAMYGAQSILSIVPSTIVKLTATPNVDSVFAGWTPAPCADTFAMPNNSLNCMATFNKTGTTSPTHVVTVNKVGLSGVGDGTVSGAGSYSEGSAVTLTVTPDANSSFSTWNCVSNGTAFMGSSLLNSPTYNFTMPTMDVMCTVYFTSKASDPNQPDPSQCTTYNPLIKPQVYIPCVTVGQTAYSVGLNLVPSRETLRLALDMATVQKITQTPTSYCAMFPFGNQLQRLRINCLDVGTSKMWVNLDLSGSDPLTFDYVDAGFP